MAGYDPLFGFDTTQKQTLVKILAALGVTLADLSDVAQGTAASLQAQIQDLDDRVTALETP